MRLGTLIGAATLPPQSMIDAAVEAMRRWLGTDKLRTKEVDQKKVKAKLDKALQKIEQWAEKHDVGTDFLEDQIKTLARRKGVIHPLPGIDF